jgi:hypothetical protein
MPRLLALLLLALLPSTASGQSRDLPLFDAHIHYSSDAWSLFDVDQALEQLDRSGIRVALVSSTPDEGTLKLYARAPERVVPILRPYRTRGDMGQWTRDPSVAAYLRQRIEEAPPARRYRGIGEFHLYAGEAADPVVAEVAQLAREHDLFLHAHADAGAVEELLRAYPDVRVLWAHAGMSASPAAVWVLLDRYADRLWVELALRYDVAGPGRVDPDWQQLFERHPTRLMVGTDTWVPSQWSALPDLKAREQLWLRWLPPDLAERLAWRNAACLFGSDRTAIARPVEGCPER